MNRRNFMKTCGLSCFAMTGIVPFFSSCAPAKLVQANESEGKIVLEKAVFNEGTSEKPKQRKQVIVRSEANKYPIAVFKNESGYTALLMRCTHQGAELGLNGDVLTCSAHGSEFNKTGAAIQGPADQDLVRYKVTEDEKNICIHTA
jgi:Rieske Fe-S protein